MRRAAASFDYIKTLYFSTLQYVMRDDLSFSYLIGTKSDQAQRLGSAANGTNQSVESEIASDFAYDHELLFNEISSHRGSNIELVLKTLRTRTTRLVSEIGTNLAEILRNLQVSIQMKNEYDSGKESYDEMRFDEDQASLPSMKGVVNGKDQARYDNYAIEEMDEYNSQSNGDG